ncbi:MAG: GNAT family N-acetyltransferase [Acidobacteriaceae bacterium]
MKLTWAMAAPEDALALVALHVDAAADLTRKFGHGAWSAAPTERGVLNQMRFSQVLTARQWGKIVGTLHLQTRKPWAIDVSYFTPVHKAIYLTGMAVHPRLQRQGVGRLLMEKAVEMTREWPADAIRLDAFDAAAGAAGFYDKCGMRDVGHVLYRKAPLVYFEMVLESSR